MASEGHQYEYRCADRLKRKGFNKVTVTRGSGDQGIDILAYKDGKKYGIQCKYYTSPVSNKAVQEAFAGAKYYGCDVAAVMTNSTFTKSAKELAEKTNVLLWENNTLKYNSSLYYKFMRIINIFMIIVGIIGVIFSNSDSSIKYPVMQKVELISITLGVFFSIVGWNFVFLEIIACTTYGIACLLSLVVGLLLNHSMNYDTLILLTIILLDVIRINSLKGNAFSKLLHDKNNLKKELRKCGKSYINDLSSKLDAAIRLVESHKTEYGKYFVYHSSDPIVGKLHALQKSFDEQSEDKFEFVPITDNDFGMKVFKNTIIYIQGNIDAYFKKAGGIVIKDGYESIDRLWMTLKIGKERAETIAWQLAEAGVIDEQHQRVIMTEQEFEYLLDNNLIQCHS